MSILRKTALAAATASMAIAASPANARYGHHRGHDGIDAGDVIAGALIIGGIAAIASAASNNRSYGYNGSYRDRGYYRDRYNDGYDNGWYRNGYGSRTAVDQCVRAAQREASRYGWARITDVTRIDRIRGGYEVRGRLVVEDRGYGRGWGRGGYDRGYYYDRYSDGYDKGRFSCTTRYGGVEDVRLGGLRT
jgi:hypothetical protein